MKDAPRPIIWYESQYLPVFIKRPEAVIFAVAEGGHCLQIQTGSKIVLPLFELPLARFSPESPRDEGGSISRALLHKMGVVTPSISPGCLYGVVKPHYEKAWMYALCFSFERLTPEFQSHDSARGTFHELTPYECMRFSLPILKSTGKPKSEPEVYRPTRFEREWVI